MGVLCAWERLCSTSVLAGSGYFFHLTFQSHAFYLYSLEIICEYFKVKVTGPYSDLVWILMMAPPSQVMVPSPRKPPTLSLCPCCLPVTLERPSPPTCLLPSLPHPLPLCRGGRGLSYLSCSWGG